MCRCRVKKLVVQHWNALDLASTHPSKDEIGLRTVDLVLLLMTRQRCCCCCQVVSKQLVGVYLTVWARKRTARHIRGVQTTSAATGGVGMHLGVCLIALKTWTSALCGSCSPEQQMPCAIAYLASKPSKTARGPYMQ